MSLNDWSKFGWLTRHRSSPGEIRNLLAVVERDLHDAASKEISADWRLNIACNAALQAATLALAASGCRASRDQHHFRVIQSLALTIGAPPALIRRFDAFLKKRNIGGYEEAGLISHREATEMQELARRLRDDVVTWLRENHRDLVVE